jgi:hypothetical protein
VFKVHFGLLTLKAYTKGEHVLRFEATVHNTPALRTGRTLERFPGIVTHLAGMVDRFCTALGCVDVGFSPDGSLDHLPLPSQIGATRVGGIVLTLRAAPDGFAIADLTDRVQSMTDVTEADYTVRCLRRAQLRGKGLVASCGRSRRCRVPPDAARTMTALRVLRDHVIGPILAGCHVPWWGRRPQRWTAIDGHYETLRRDMVARFDEIGITRQKNVAA